LLEILFIIPVTLTDLLKVLFILVFLFKFSSSFINFLIYESSLLETFLKLQSHSLCCLTFIKYFLVSSNEKLSSL